MKVTDVDGVNISMTYLGALTHLLENRSKNEGTESQPEVSEVSEGPRVP